MRRLAGVLLVLGLVAPVGLLAQKADFSGTWVLDREKSDPAPGGRGTGGGGGGGGTPPMTVTLVIKQTPTQLVIERKAGENTSTATYALDGTESTNPGGRGGDVKSKSKWEGNTIVTESSRTMQDTTVQIKEVRSSTADGKTMTVEQTTTGGPQGTTTRKTVYTKE